MAWNWLKNKKYPYAGGGEKPTSIKSQNLNDGVANLKNEMGKVFDYISGKKKKKKPEEEA